ncbi:MAG: helix-turn-helix domain-containing protein [Clostridia bacterium]|nr:helix-turn-helix domain-containing protein [Clostridia bacterium]
MDQVKIGRFIAACRKQKDLTQLQLAEELGITDKAISKWERGKAMPDTSIMIELCDLLEINVNELLSGERINMESINLKNEKLLLDMTKEVEQKNKMIWATRRVLLLSSLVFCLISTAVVYRFVPEGIWQYAIMAALVAVLLVPGFYATKLDVTVGTYKCQKCNHEFAPTYLEELLTPHTTASQFFKCPKCGKRSWCRKIVNGKTVRF